MDAAESLYAIGMVDGIFAGIRAFDFAPGPTFGN